MEAAPNDTTLGRQYLYVGAQPYSTSNDGRYRLFMHFNTQLPQARAETETALGCASRESHPSEDLSELPPLLVTVAGQEYQR